MGWLADVVKIYKENTTQSLKNTFTAVLALLMIVLVVSFIINEVSHYKKPRKFFGVEFGPERSISDDTPAGGLIPQGSIVFFSQDECPTGWSEYENLRGRVIVGSNTQIENTVGAALGSRKTRTISNTVIHRHDIRENIFDFKNYSKIQRNKKPIEIIHNHILTFRKISAELTIVDDPTQLSTIIFAQKDQKNEGGPVGKNSIVGPHIHNMILPSHKTNYRGNRKVDVTMPYIQLLACKKNRRL